MEDRQPEGKKARSLKVYGVADGKRNVIPQLRLQGKWLEDCGFPTGCRISVECKDGQLTIRRLAGKKIAVVGSRSISAFDLSPYIPTDCELIISGGAKGVDTLAEKYALSHEIETLILKPDYERFGRGAPLKRNESMIQQADMVLAVWNGKSRGTAYSIEYAKKQGKPVQVITITEQTK